MYYAETRKNRKRTLLSIVILCLVVIGCSACQAQADAIKPAEIGQQKTGEKSKLTDMKNSAGEYIITLTDDADESSIDSLFSEYSIQVVKDLKKNRFLVTFNPDPGIDQLKSDIQALSEVIDIQPNYIYKATGTGRRMDGVKAE